VLIRKTVVGSRMIDRVSAKLGRKRYEVPVVFKWFVDGSVWTTEKRRQQSIGSSSNGI